MIWDDPWIAVATDQGGEPRTFCTTLPPPVPDLPLGVIFQCVRVSDLIDLHAWVNLQMWADLVRTRWTVAELRQRLQNAWIPCLSTADGLVGTCVLRPVGSKWILETLKAQSGYGTLLMRSVMTWIWRHVGGPFVLAYTWELTAAQLVGAWWRGWLTSAASIQYGWVWRDGACTFCPEQEAWSPIGPRPVVPLLVDGAVVSDSGLGDGWGYVSSYTGTPDWTVVAKKGGWRSLWMRSMVAPAPTWRWTGEFVVVGLLNQWTGSSDSLTDEVTWLTAEIASG
jgi:hypothetical protein